MLYRDIIFNCRYQLTNIMIAVKNAATPQSPPFLTRTPTTRELYIHVVKRVADRWEELCMYLELDKDGAKLAAIRRDFVMMGVDTCCIQVFYHWLKGEGRLPVNWDTVIACLRDMEVHRVVKEIEKVLGENHVISSCGKAVPDSTPLVALTMEVPQPPVNRYHLKPNIEKDLRDYQWELALPGLSGQNYIICAPTGSGKTRVAGLVISEHLKQLDSRGKVVFIVNKVPLVQQQRSALQEMIEGVKIDEVSGDVAPHKKAMLSANLRESSSSEDDDHDNEKRFDLDNDIIVCTAGCLINQLDRRTVSLSAISLMVIDECHNTRKNSIYARIMENYISAKLSGSAKLPQVVGLTATPGAGESVRPSINSVLDHMITLCAAMDATGGVQIVKKNIPELRARQTSAIHTRAVLEGRSEDEPFIALVVSIATKLEKMFKFKPPSDFKWSHKYSSWVSTQLHSYQDKDKSRDFISVLKTLKCFSSMLQVYQKLTFEDALSELDDLVFPPAQIATPNEKSLSGVISSLKKKLKSLDRRENPLLLQVENILEQKFKSMPSSKAIVFVETKNEATSIHRWIQSRPKLQDVHIHPDVVTGQTRDTGKKMTKAEQNTSLEGFRGSEFNLLVSTSVLEEGLDIPACNLVISYQKVTSEIAQVQSRGRARASHSHSVTIVTSDSGKQFQELLNEEKNFLVEQVLEMLPTGENLRNAMQAKQEAILKQIEMRKEADVNRKKLYSPLEVDIHCNYCSAFICNGSDVHTIPTTRHYVVTNEEILARVLVKDHHNPANIERGLSRTHKLYCEHCEVQDLGVMGRWWKDHVKYPVIKCSTIKLVTKDKVIRCKKWKTIPFEVSPLI